MRRSRILSWALLIPSVALSCGDDETIVDGTGSGLPPGSSDGSTGDGTTSNPSDDDTSGGGSTSGATSSTAGTTAETTSGSTTSASASSTSGTTPSGATTSATASSGTMTQSSTTASGSTSTTATTTATSSNGTTTSAPSLVCGDGIKGPNESCDDGNDLEGDGCDEYCRWEPGSDRAGECGDGVKEWDEDCDWGTDGSAENLDDLGFPSPSLPYAQDVQVGPYPDCTGPLFNPQETKVNPADSFDPRNLYLCNNDSMGCTTGCTLATCGDGRLQLGESCDFGTHNGSGLRYDSALVQDCFSPAVGPPQCQDPPVGPGYDDDDTCDANCALGSCGDATVDSPEECDNGSGNTDDGLCTPQCTLARCGDGHLHGDLDSIGAFYGQELCDDGNLVGGDGCSPFCQPEVCGDGRNDVGEECDFGTEQDTTPDGDDDFNECDEDRGGRDQPTVPPCSNNGSGNPPDDCACNVEPTDVGKNGARELGCFWTDGNCTTGRCSTSCKRLECGDGIHDRNEECDDGNTDFGDGCNAFCDEEVCGDGVVQPQLGEQCDEGTNNLASGCDTTCQLRAPGQCGNSVINTAEECDDGANNGDGAPCNALCRLNRCGDGTINLQQNDDQGDGDNPDVLCSINEGGNNRWDQACTDDLVEECDDGNSDPSDHCITFWPVVDSKGCPAGEECGYVENPNNALNNEDAIIISNGRACVAHVCGDGIVAGSGGPGQGLGIGPRIAVSGWGPLPNHAAEQCDFGQPENVVDRCHLGDNGAVCQFHRSCNGPAHWCDPSGQNDDVCRYLSGSPNQGVWYECNHPQSACSLDCEDASCGDGVRQWWEQCDGADYIDDKDTCFEWDPSWNTGVLACTSKCKIDPSDCG